MKVNYEKIGKISVFLLFLLVILGFLSILGAIFGVSDIFLHPDNWSLESICG